MASSLGIETSWCCNLTIVGWVRECQGANRSAASLAGGPPLVTGALWAGPSQATCVRSMTQMHCIFTSVTVCSSLQHPRDPTRLFITGALLLGHLVQLWTDCCLGAAPRRRRKRLEVLVEAPRAQRGSRMGRPHPHAAAYEDMPPPESPLVGKIIPERRSQQVGSLWAGENPLRGWRDDSARCVLACQALCLTRDSRQRFSTVQSICAAPKPVSARRTSVAPAFHCARAQHIVSCSSPWSSPQEMVRGTALSTDDSGAGQAVAVGLGNCSLTGRIPMTKHVLVCGPEPCGPCKGCGKRGTVVESGPPCGAVNTTGTTEESLSAADHAAQLSRGRRMLPTQDDKIC